MSAADIIIIILLLIVAFFVFKRIFIKKSCCGYSSCKNCDRCDKNNNR